MANYACLKCGHVLEVPAPYVHRQVRCPRCSERFVPADSTAPVSSAVPVPNADPQDAPVRASGKRGDVILWGLVITTAAVVTWVFAVYGTPVLDGWGVGYLSPFLFVLVPAISAYIALAFFGYSQCPSCRKLWTRSNLGAEEVARGEGYETVYRKDEIRGYDGSHQGFIDRKEQIHVARVRMRTYCVCTSCSHEWHVDSNHTIR